MVCKLLFESIMGALFQRHSPTPPPTKPVKILRGIQEPPLGSHSRAPKNTFPPRNAQNTVYTTSSDANSTSSLLCGQRLGLKSFFLLL